MLISAIKTFIILLEKSKKLYTFGAQLKKTFFNGSYGNKRKHKICGSSFLCRCCLCCFALFLVPQDVQAKSEAPHEGRLMKEATLHGTQEASQRPF